MPVKKEIGNAAEDRVSYYMSSLGYQIITRNYTVPRMGEIDIIARFRQNLYFVEVKARSNPNPFGGMEGCISSQKLKRIRRCADMYLQKQKDQDVYCKIVGAFVHATPEGNYEKIQLIQLD